MNVNQVFNISPISAITAAYQPSFINREQHSKVPVVIVAVLGVTTVALAAALVVNRSEAQPGFDVSTSVPAARLVSETPEQAHPIAKHNAAQSMPVQASHASFCADCVTVEAVTAVQRQGQVNGVAVGNQTISLGTVAGGLIGGLLGNQVGGGNGKTLATVAGLAGVALAGNTIETNMRQVTVHDARLRMDDGSKRNMEVSSIVPVGFKVIVEDKTYAWPKWLGDALCKPAQMVKSILG